MFRERFGTNPRKAASGSSATVAFGRLHHVPFPCLRLFLYRVYPSIRMPIVSSFTSFPSFLSFPSSSSCPLLFLPFLLFLFVPSFCYSLPSLLPSFAGLVPSTVYASGAWHASGARSHLLLVHSPGRGTALRLERDIYGDGYGFCVSAIGGCACKGVK